MTKQRFRCATTLVATLCAFATMFPFCSAKSAMAQDWPQWRGAKRDGTWAETGLIEKFSGPEIKVKWRVPVANGYSAPTVASGRVYVADQVTEPKHQERVHCFDWQTGKELWTYSYDCLYKGISYPNGPRGSVTINDGRAYFLGAMGNLHCFDAAKGTILWSKDLYTDYKIRMPDWGLAAAPLVEGNLLIVSIGGENASLVALDRKTGKEVWHALPDGASYSSPIVIDQAGKRVLICWTAERLVGLDASTGKLYWEQAFPPVNKPMAFITTPVVSGNWLFIASAAEGSMMLRLKNDTPGVLKVWQRVGRGNGTDALQSVMATPILRGDYVYGIDYFGELRCLDATSGDRLWESKTIMPRGRWATAHLVQNGDKTWIFNERGELIVARLTPKGYEEISRALLIKPTRGQLNERGGVAWAHPAFAYQHVFARNDEELICASLKAAG